MKTLKICILTIFCIAMALPAVANDGTYYTRGNQLIPLQETNISVRREVLTISLMDNGFARVDVQYEFWNPGVAKTVTMGFEADPPYNFDYKFYPDGRHPSISLFTVEMNGRTLPYRNAACVLEENQNCKLPLRYVDTTKRYYVFDNNLLYEDDGRNEPTDFDAGLPFAYVYYFEADFQPGLNRVHHSYVYKMSTNVGSPFIVEYKLTPAARWAGGNIEDFTLTIRADSTAKHFFVFDTLFGDASFAVSEGMGKLRRSERYGNPTEVSLRNGAITLHRTHFAPKSELTIMAVGIEGLYVDNKCITGGTYDRSARIDWGPYEGMQWVPADAAFRQRVMRNLPYAHRGHVFADKKLKAYFESLWWYMPDPSYKDDTGNFTEVDWQFVNYNEDFSKVQGSTEAQSKQRIGQLANLISRYGSFTFYADCNLAVYSDSTDLQGIANLDGIVLLPAQYRVYRQIIDGHESPFFLIMDREKVGLLDKEMRWTLPMEYDNNFDCMEGCYAPFIHWWFWNGQACLRKDGKYGIVDTVGRIVVPFTSDVPFPLDDKEIPFPPDTIEAEPPVPPISGPYEHIYPLSEDLFEFSTGNPIDRSDHITGYVDRYGNTTATPSQLATMEKWIKGVVEYDVKTIPVTSVVPLGEGKSSYATVYVCLSNADTIGHLLVPQEDTSSMRIFNKCVSEDPWGNAVDISTKRYNAGLDDVRQTETLLPEVMKNGVFPQLGQWCHYIGNPDNYTKYERTYGFYYNEKEERCAYIQMTLDKPHSHDHVGFSTMWDACDTVVYINLNLDSRKVIKACASSCQSY